MLECRRHIPEMLGPYSSHHMRDEKRYGIDCETVGMLLLSLRKSTSATVRIKHFGVSRTHVKKNHWFYLLESSLMGCWWIGTVLFAAHRKRHTFLHSRTNRPTSQLIYFSAFFDIILMDLGFKFQLFVPSQQLSQ